MPRRYKGCKGWMGTGIPPAPIGFSPEPRPDDILLDRDGKLCDGDAVGTFDFQERPYVILPDKGSEPSIAKSTHAVDIFAFVDAREIPFRCFQAPYYLVPAPGGEKVYALLRETLRRSRKIGIAYVVIQMRRQLAALVPQGQSLVLNILRCENEFGAADSIPAWFDEPDDCGLNEAELALARQLVDSMTEQWDVLLQTDRLQHGTEALDAFDTAQAAPFEAQEVICLDEVLDWMEQQDEIGYDEDLLGMMSSRPHRHFPAPASRRSGLARASGPRAFRPRVRRTS
jgi:Ku protein